MATSKNDFPIGGYFGRQKVFRKSKQYEANYMLKNPATKKPYTVFELIADLLQRKKEFSQFACLIDPWLKMLYQKTDCTPKTIFSMCRIGKTKEQAITRLERQCWTALESLACLLYRPLYQRNLAYGDVTIADFVLYQRDALYCNALPDTRKRLLGYLNKIILPQIGNQKLKDYNAARQKKALNAINVILQGSKPTRCGYVRSAYRGLLQAIEGSGWMGCSAGMRLVSLIGANQNRNVGILNSGRAAHLDDDQRAALFQILKQPEFSFEWFMLSLIYSGLDPADIAAAHFGDFEELVLQNGHCYTMLVTQRARKLNDRYSTVSATNPEFPIQKFRRIVIVPWAEEILLQRLKQLREKGLSDAQIHDMRLSDEAPGGAIVGPAEISDRLRRVLKLAGIENPGTIRTSKKGHAYRQNIPADISLLLADAQHLAKKCGADTVMLHAMFGAPWTEIDEISYVDLLCDDYAVTRYLRLRRWSPLTSDSPSEYDEQHLVGYTHAPSSHLLQVKNTTDHSTTLTLSARSAFKAYWNTQKGEQSAYDKEIQSTS